MDSYQSIFLQLPFWTQVRFPKFTVVIVCHLAHPFLLLYKPGMYLFINLPSGGIQVLTAFICWECAGLLVHLCKNFSKVYT